MLDFALIIAFRVINSVVNHPELLKLGIHVNTSYDPDTLDDALFITTPLLAYQTCLTAVPFIQYHIIKQDIALFTH